jgi:hypothetical protein
VPIFLVWPGFLLARYWPFIGSLFALYQTFYTAFRQASALIQDYKAMSGKYRKSEANVVP